MNFRISALVLALASCPALAQEPQFQPGQLYGQEDTLSQVSDGFYARVDADGEAYVATTPAGHRALLQKLLEMRARTPVSAKAARLGYTTPFFFDDLIATLSQPQPKNQDIFGDCSGPTGNINSPMRVQALAGGGFAGSTYGASGMASNASNPIINTTNYSTAAVYNVDGDVLAQQTTTQYGATAAAASAYNAAHGCSADSRTTITCPGHTSPSLTAIATNRRQFPSQCTPR